MLRVFNPGILKPVKEKYLLLKYVSCMPLGYVTFHVVFHILSKGFLIEISRSSSDMVLVPLGNNGICLSETRKCDTDVASTANKGEENNDGNDVCLICPVGDVCADSKIHFVHATPKISTIHLLNDNTTPL
jgi:hypothetical protein